MASPQPPYNLGFYPHYPYPNPAGYHPQYAQHPNGHPPIHTPPRINGVGPSTGPGRGGYYPNRGGPPGYHNYHQLPPQHLMQPPQAAAPSPPPISPTYPHPPKSHPSHLAYPNFPPQNGPYPTSWSTEPLSPLPKQLSMLTPLPSSQLSSQNPPPSEPSKPPSEPPPNSPVNKSMPSSSSSPRTSSLLIFEKSDPPLTPISSEVAPTISAVENSAIVYAIWSRRPHDPSAAPAIIISPRACPPQSVVEDAIDLRTPPLTPIQPAKVLSGDLVHDLPSDLERDSATVSPLAADIPSSSASETTPACSTAPDTPMPGSPGSSNTSLSVAASPQNKVPTTPGFSGEESSTEIPLVQDNDQPSAPVPPPVAKTWASLLRSDGSSNSKQTPNTLPVSSVVGFSIPGGLESSQPTPPSLRGKKQDILILLTSGPAGPGQVPKIIPRGLVNSGNMCFANAVLQILVYCQPFYRLLTELGKFLPNPGAGSFLKKAEDKTPLLHSAIQFLKEFDPPDKDKRRKEEDEDEEMLNSFTPTCIYDAMKEKKRFDNMRGGHQEDAEEFLGFYLDTLEDELLFILDSFTPPARPSKAAPSVEEREEDEPRDNGWMEVGRRNRTVVTRTTKARESPITRIFGGSFRSTLRVPSQKDSAVVETWRALQLDIQREQVHTISEALQFISHPQSVQVTSQTRPGITIEASQQVLIETLPPVLVLHLKRFLYDTDVGGVVKVGKPISFTPELGIDPELLTPARRSSQTVKYKLFGVLYHHGSSASGGHYTLDVLHPNRDMTVKPREGWLRIDDELVSDILPKDVFNDVDADHRCPYLLFYRRMTASWSPTAKA